jgi:glycosyltransferase 2 family protein
VKHKARYAVIAVLTVAFLALFLWKSDPRSVWAILRSTRLSWILLGFAGNMLALLCRTARWRTILDPDDPPPFYPTFLANAVGYMLSTVLPIRAGDFVRPAILSRRTRVRFPRALGTVLTERILDLATILGMFLFFVLSSGRRFAYDPSTAGKYFIIGAGGIGAALLLAAILTFTVGMYFFRLKVRRLHEWLGRLIPARFRPSWMSFFDAFAATLDLAHHRTALAKVLFFTGGIWLGLTCEFIFVLRSLGHSLPYESSFFMTGITTVSFAVPTPGGVGGFHKACQLVLTNFYHFDIDTSVAVAVLFHLVGVVPVIVTGVALVVREGMSIAQLSRVEETAAETVGGSTSEPGTITER